VKPNHVWVIEMWNPDRKRWEPCADAGITKSMARERISNDWCEMCPNRRFRVVKYVTAGGAHD
jgi:hypothetical protein